MLQRPVVGVGRVVRSLAIVVTAKAKDWSPTLSRVSVVVENVDADVWRTIMMLPLSTVPGASTKRPPSIE